MRDFFEDHKKLCIILAVVLVLIIVMFSIRSHNLKKKANTEADNSVTQSTQVAQSSQIKQDEEVKKEPENTYKNSLGLDADKDKDERIQYEVETETEPEPTEPVQTDPTYTPVVTIYDHTVVPQKNMDGSSCKAYQSSVKLADFGTFWGSSLTDDDFKAGEFYMVGVTQNKDDTIKGDLQSTGWLIDNLDSLADNDCIKFTNLHVIGSLSDTHTALLCSYDWYSAFGLKDTLVVFEDISNTLSPSDFEDGDIFSALVFRHNVKVETVKGQRVIVVQYATFK